ncbi:hypothetical protein [Methylomicrobium sp. Wu6]|nr:hypothetical protein [Methylomicrobium sp. Wu6]MEC4749408.1 hypothetical protein [Methylomicrobium sp. Wu6]
MTEAIIEIQGNRIAHNKTYSRTISGGDGWGGSDARVLFARVKH